MQYKLTWEIIVGILSAHGMKAVNVEIIWRNIIKHNIS